MSRMRTFGSDIDESNVLLTIYSYAILHGQVPAHIPHPTRPERTLFQRHLEPADEFEAYI